MTTLALSGHTVRAVIEQVADTQQPGTDLYKALFRAMLIELPSPATEVRENPPTVISEIIEPFARLVEDLIRQ